MHFNGFQQRSSDVPEVFQRALVMFQEVSRAFLKCSKRIQSVKEVPEKIQDVPGGSRG